MASHIRNSALYRDRLTENELISDYPADEPLIGGLHALQAYFVAQGQYIDIPVVRVMNAAHFLACYMFSIPCTDRNEYDAILYEYVGYDKQLALITLVVLVAMLRRTDAPRARTCRSVLLEDRSDDLYEGVSLYEKFVNDTQQTFPTEAFDTDIMREVISLRNQNKELIQEVLTLQSTLDTMKQNLNQYNAPVYQGCTFTTNNVTNNNYYQAPSDSQPDTPQPHDTPQPPFEGGEGSPLTPEGGSRMASGTMNKEKKAEEYFGCITRAAIEAGKAEQVENELRSATISAPKLVQCIRTNEALGYIDTKNLSSQALYDQLNEHFGLSYGVRNFTIARNR